MAFIPVLPAADDRAARGLVPIWLTNCQLVPQAKGVNKRAPYAVQSRWGMTRRYTFAANVRGVFSRVGVVNSTLFVVAGTTLYSVSSAYVATSIGTVTGTDRVLFDNLRATLVIVANGLMWTYDGTTFAQVTDIDLPANLNTLASLGQRIVVTPLSSDTLSWSAVLNAASWPALGFATSEVQPDPVVGMMTVGTDLWAFGSNTLQPWRAVGDTDDNAFQPVTGATRSRGCKARDTIDLADESPIWLGDDRVLYMASGYDPIRLENQALEERLRALSEPAIWNTVGYCYHEGSRLYYVLRPVTGAAAVYDVGAQLFHERTSWDRDAYRATFFALAYDKRFVADVDDTGLWSLEPDAYSDDGDVIDKTMTFHVPLDAATRIDSVTIDMQVFGQPVSGQGSDPEAMVTFYRDGGNVESLSGLGIERKVKLGVLGNYDAGPKLNRFGLFRGRNGALLKLRVTDPVGITVNGIWVNEEPD